MGFPDNTVRYIKIGETQIVIDPKNNKDIIINNLHVMDGIEEAITDNYDTNSDLKISTESYASIFLNDLKELIGDDKEITDQEIEAYLEKNHFVIGVDKVKETLLSLFSSRKETPFGGKIEAIKIGNSKIYIGENLTQDIDLSRYCQKGYCDNQFLQQFMDSETMKINSCVEADALYKVIEELINDNNEITDDAIKSYLGKNPQFKNIDYRWFREFLIQSFPPPKTEEEKLAYFDKNQQNIKKITGVSNLLHTTPNNENIQIGQEIVREFQKEYGSPESTSMQILIQKEYYQRNTKNAEAIGIIRTSPESELSNMVKQYGVANCEEDAKLTINLLKEKYPDKAAIEISFMAENGLSDTGHIAVLITDKKNEENFEGYRDYNISSEAVKSHMV